MIKTHVGRDGGGDLVFGGQPADEGRAPATTDEVEDAGGGGGGRVVVVVVAGARHVVVARRVQHVVWWRRRWWRWQGTLNHRQSHTVMGCNDKTIITINVICYYY